MKVAVLTVSDRSARGERQDLSGPAVVDRVRRKGWDLVRTGIVSDDQGAIEGELRKWTEAGIELILTTGGTGFAPRDRAPEATLAVCERLAPGIPEAMRRAGKAKTPHAILSRAVAGIRRGTLIVNLPGSPSGAIESLDAVLPALEHAVRLLREDSGAESEHRG
ncbi:MAG TPA: MogA/MoaB family molybdenum cofactor biosynthesis protein [Anaerolineales bacterium]|nr:MogA/MoaB family molybdenum cofactor biosynthesis protein [Anaerolineales bacterium]